MRVGPIRFHGSPRPPTSACDQIKLQTFFDGAGLALCCGPRRVGRDMPVGLLLVGPTNLNGDTTLENLGDFSSECFQGIRRTFLERKAMLPHGRTLSALVVAMMLASAVLLGQGSWLDPYRTVTPRIVGEATSAGSAAWTRSAELTDTFPGASERQPITRAVDSMGRGCNDRRRTGERVDRQGQGAALGSGR